MSTHLVQQFNLRWQNIFTRKKSSEPQAIDSAVVAIAGSRSDESSAELSAEFKRIEQVAQQQRLPIWAKTACQIASSITQHVFRSYHAFYEERLSLDLKVEGIQQLSRVISSEGGFDLYVKENSSVLKGQLMALATAKGSGEVHNIYKDIKAAQDLVVIVTDLKWILDEYIQIKEGRCNFGNLSLNTINAPTKEALIDRARRSQNHALADQIQSSSKYNPLILEQLLTGNPSLVAQAYREYSLLIQALHLQYSAFTESSDVPAVSSTGFMEDVQIFSQGSRSPSSDISQLRSRRAGSDETLLLDEGSLIESVSLGSQSDSRFDEVSTFYDKPVSDSLVEVAQRLKVAGSLAKVMDHQVRDVYEVGIERLAGSEQIQAIAERFRSQKVRVTHLGVEYAPFLKQGGLGEALEGLTQAMKVEGADVRVLFPLYSSIGDKIKGYDGVVRGSFKNSEDEDIKTYTINHKGVEIVFFEHKDFALDSARPNIYDEETSSRSRFARFNECAAAWLYQNKDSIDVIHLHDWHVATVAKILATKHPKDWSENRVPAVTFTLHNISKYAQGRTGDALAAGAYAYGLGLVPMLDALRFSDMVTTVSRVFAEEIQLPQRGEGLDSVMRHLASKGKLVGILNGSNPEKWNPATDGQLASWRLSAESDPIDLRCSADHPIRLFAQKAKAKECFALWLDQQRPLLTSKNTQLFNKIDPSKPLFAVVTRYDSNQKGLDFYEHMIDSVIAKGGQIAIVGSQEDPEASLILNRLVKKYAQTDGVVIVRDEKLPGGYRYQQGTSQNAPMGSLVRFACDVMFMTPSYEPSGLTQFEGWGFGSLVFSSDTGGLSESVKTPEKYGPNFTGWLFNRAKGKADLDRAVTQAMSYLISSSQKERAEKMAFVINEASLYGWGSSSDLRQSPVRQYFTAYEEAKKAASNRGRFLSHDILGRLRTVEAPTVEKLSVVDLVESQRALDHFLGRGEITGALVAGIPVAYGEGVNKTLHHQLGAHKLPNGSFQLTVMAPKAQTAGVILYDDEGNQTRTISLIGYDGGVWQTDLDFPQGTKYRLLINGKEKLDPYAQSYARLRDNEGLFNVLYHDDYEWSAKDADHIASRAQNNRLATANMFEIFPQTWAVEHGVKTWSQLAPSLIAHAKAGGYTHIELMGVLPFPFTQSMGYQVMGHFAPDYRLGSPEEFKKLIDLLHQNGIGVIADFIPGHVAKDELGLGNFDGSPLYEISGLQKVSAQAMVFGWGHHMNLSSPFVQAHLLSSANWMMEQHIDGLRVDAVLSMLIHHDPAASARFMKHLNGLIKTSYPYCFTVAEDYSGMERVLKPFENEGLSFDAKWNISFKNYAMNLLRQSPENSQGSLVALVKQQSGKQAGQLVKFLSHDEFKPGTPSLLESVFVSAAPDEFSTQKRCAKLSAFFALVRLLPGPSLIFMGADSFSDYKWKPMNPHDSFQETQTPIPVTEKLKKASRESFYQGLQEVVALIGEQTSCTLKYIPESQAAVTYKLSGKNMDVLVLVNFSQQPYVSLYKDELIKPGLEPMSVRVLKLDEDGKIEEELWNSSSSISYPISDTTLVSLPHPQRASQTLRSRTQWLTVPLSEYGADYLSLLAGRSSTMAQRQIAIEVGSLSFKERTYHLLLGISESIPVLGRVVAQAEAYFQEGYLDQNGLISSRHSVSSHQYFWHLNLALLRSSYEAATGPRKELIKFLAANYLAKVSPKKLDHFAGQLRSIDSEYLSKHQGSPVEEYRYHRECIEQGLFYGKKLNKKLVFGEKSLFLLTDTLEIEHLFPLRFTVIDKKTSVEAWSEIITKVCLEHLLKHEDGTWKKALSHPLLLDLTGFIDVQTGASKQTEPLIVSLFETLRKQFESKLAKAIDELIRQRPDLAGQRSKIEQCLNHNVTCISRVNIDGAQGIKMLPIGFSSSKTAQAHSPLINFVIHTGLYMGAVNLRRMTDDVFEQRLDIDYGVTSRPSSGFYYLTKEDFTSTRVFQRLLSLFGSQPIASQSWISLLGGVFGVIDPASIAIRYGIDLDTLQERVALIERKPHIKVLGKATVDLLEGLFKEIDEEKWQKINRDLVLSQVFQTALFLIQEHLANAELSAVSGNFNKFAEKIELVHAELATLMELVKPFKATDFDEIYQKELLDHSVPLELAGCLSAGLGKTGVNIFTGIALAAKNEGQSLQGVHGLGLYFEETLFTPHEFESFMTTPSLPKISLYLGQFNPNIDVGSTLTEYKPRDVAADVRRLLDSGRVQTNFTVAVDVTIDEFYSKSSKKLLDQFKSEILAGKINFIFFSSVIGHGGT